MKRIMLSSLAFLSLLLLTVTTASATVRVPGVAPGNFFTYADLFFNWYSNDPNATIPSYLQDFNETQWLMVSITNVQGTNVTAHQVQHFKNGTDKESNGYVDVATGTGVNLTLFIVAANLNATDSVYTASYYTDWRINETISRTYQEGPRQTNHLNITMSFPMPPNTTLHMSQSFYWDRPTGVSVEVSLGFRNETGPHLTTMYYGYRITSSSVWTVPEFPTWAPILILLTTFTSVAVIHKRRLQKKQTR